LKQLEFLIYKNTNNYRKEFGLLWNALTESGGVVVSDQIKIHAEVQLIKQAEPVAV